MAAPKKKRSIFNFYNSQKVGKGVPKGPPPKFDLANFFPLLWRNINNLGKINLLYVFGNFPFLFGLYALTGNLNANSYAPASELFSQIHGAALIGGYNPAMLALYGVHGIQSQVSINTPLTTLFLALTGLIIFIFGPVNTGTTYLIRNIIKGVPLFFFSDFFHAVKRNLRQAVIVGILDCVIIALLCYNIFLTYFNLGSLVTGIIFYANIMLLFVYFIMRFYIYIMLVTFDLKIFKLYKNAFIFSVLGGRRNLLAVTGIGLALVINYALIYVFLPLGILIPFVILFSAGAFMAAYAAYPKIKEIMIDPYYSDPSPQTEKPIFQDRG